MNETRNVLAAPKKNPVCVAVGKSLKSIRISKKLSQAELAFMAEMDRTFVSHIERGITNPSLLTLANLCSALGITLSELFDPLRDFIPHDASPHGTPKRPRPPRKVAQRRLS